MALMRHRRRLKGSRNTQKNQQVKKLGRYTQKFSEGLLKEMNLNAENTSSSSAKFHFCTIVTKGYLLKVLALYLSLQRTNNNFHLWICCMDDITLTLLQKINLKYATPFPVSTLEDQELLAVKDNRKINEYCWTLKAPLLQYVLDKPDVKEAVYCDGDIFFFSNPDVILKEWKNHSIFLCPQRDLEWVHEKYGSFQAGLIGFKKDSIGLSALSWWRQKCIEWCYAISDDEIARFGDQKYLDIIPSMFENVKISNNLGIDAAPWNSIYNNNYEIFSSNGNITIEKDKLTAFHFACMEIFNENEFDLWTFVNLPMSGIVKSNIYLPYIKAIREVIDIIRPYCDGELNVFFSTKSPNDAKTYYNYSPFRLLMDKFDEFYCLCTIVSNKNFLKGLVLYHSLKSKLANFNLWICCIDDKSYYVLRKMKLKHVTVINVSEIKDAELSAVRSNCSTDEFSLTIKASLILHLLNNIRMSSLIYCDSDIYFLSDPRPIIDLWKNHSIFLCKSRDNTNFQNVHGIFQSGLLGFRYDKNSFDILNWWREKCISSYAGYPQGENERFESQKYLDEIPLLFSSIKLIDHPGIGAAPWNIINNNYKIEVISGKVYIGGRELIAYNFGTMSIFNENEFDLWNREPIELPRTIIDLVYVPYLKSIKRIIHYLRALKIISIKDFYVRAAINNIKNYFRLP